MRNRAISLTTFVVALFGMILVFGLVVVTIVKIDGREEREDDQKTVDAAYVGCLRYNDTRLVLRSIVERAYAEPSTAFDITQLSEYQHIEDPDVQALLRRLTSPTAGNDRTSVLEEQRNKTATRDCEREYPKHSPGLTIEPTIPLIPPPPLQR